MHWLAAMQQHQTPTVHGVVAPVSHTNLTEYC
jgi:hypothetical protein